MRPRKIKILLIEDDYFLSGIYLAKFGLEGFEIISSRDAEKGLELSKKEKPDLILLDILLPNKDGFWALKELKNDSTTKNIPVIVMTNLSEEENIRKAFDYGASEYLVKSNFLPNEVIEKVKKLIKKN